MREFLSLALQLLKVTQRFSTLLTHHSPQCKVDLTTMSLSKVLVFHSKFSFLFVLLFLGYVKPVVCVVNSDKNEIYHCLVVGWLIKGL